MEIIVVLLSVKILTVDGKIHLKRCILRILLLNVWSGNSKKRGKSCFIATCMGTVAKRTSLCTVTTSQKCPTRPVFSLIWSPSFAITSALKTQDSQTISAKSQLRELRCGVNFKYPVYSPWKHLSAVLIRVNSKINISKLSTWWTAANCFWKPCLFTAKLMSTKRLPKWRNLTKMYQQGLSPLFPRLHLSFKILRKNCLRTKSWLRWPLEVSMEKVTPDLMMNPVKTIWKKKNYPRSYRSPKRRKRK